MEFEAGRALMSLLKANDPRAVSAVLTLVNSSKKTSDLTDNGVDAWFSAGEEKKNGWKEIEEK